ncbi:hypothetical protein QE152_g13002 [Popillia japonica]|uniref:Uncharacterized protein n=1 Tax=Popillia japonica TaxID=7064 RepID=A0AAW1LFR2_POPJA
MNFDNRLKLDNFQEPTTYANDYRPYQPVVGRRYRWAKATEEKAAKVPPTFYEEDIETFYPFKKEHHVPFNLLWRPRPIVETNPNTAYPKHLKKEEDLGKDEAIKTRPRLYISPAISMDDIPEREMREMICKGVYQTDWRRAEEEVWKYLKKSKREVFDSIKDADRGIEYTCDLYPPIPEKWRNYATKWDHKQIRASVDPTKQFWLNQKLEPKSEGNPLEELVPSEVKQEIADLIENEKLRLPHDKVKPGYAGYQAKLSKGVTLAKSDFPVTHPSMTVSQAISIRWGDSY